MPRLRRRPLNIARIPASTHMTPEPSITAPAEQSLVDIFATHHDLQRASPLFNLIPGEIRNTIFKLALSEYEDIARPYEKHSHWFRPGYHFHGRIDTDLLLTCRLIYLETRLVPVIVNEHVFWFQSRERMPPELANATNPSAYFSRMSAVQKDAVRHLHLFTQQYWLEGSFPRMPSLKINPTSVTITIRHTDWWFWETNQRLGIDPWQVGRASAGNVVLTQNKDAPAHVWGRRFAGFVGLERLVLELETIEPNKEQLDAIVENQAKKWQFNLHDGWVLSSEALKIERYRWIGTSAFKGSVLSLPTVTEPTAGGSTEKSTEKKADGIIQLKGFDVEGTDDGMPYYMVKLTWKAQK